MKKRHSVVPAVYVFMKNDKDELLLIRRQNTGYMDGFYTPPSGHLDGGESLATATIREAFEEVGVEINPGDLEFSFMSHYMAEEGDGHERMSFFFTAKSWKGEPFNKEPEKCDELRWVAMDSLPDNMVSPAKYALESMQAGKVYGDHSF